MTAVSRFNPTPNGPLHVGHIYSALVNQAIADQFLLRFDDNQDYWKARLGEAAIEQYAAGQLRDLLWMGIRPDAVAYNSKMEDAMRYEMARSHWRMVYVPPDAAPIIVSNPRIEPWGPELYLTAEKVILDHIQGVTVMARGLELLQENALYLYLCGIFGYPIPREMVYIPRLMAYDGAELADISKTRGNWKVQELRERGISPEAIRRVLRRACLRESDGSWDTLNIKSAPVLPVSDPEDMIKGVAV